MRKITTKIGDIFTVPISENAKKYFQFVASDISQLNSDVIRVFRRKYSREENPDLHHIINEDIEFYAHCVTKWGIKLGFWEKIGNLAEIGEVNVLFRDTNDYGSGATISYDWYIWRINDEFQRVGRLLGENQRAEIGVVIAPDSIVHRMKTGEYDFFYPKYE